MPRSLRFALPIVTTLLAIGLALTLILTETAGTSTRGPSPSPSSTPAGAAPPTAFAGAALPPGIRAPDFTLTDWAGRRVTLGAYRGQVVILTFLVPTTTGASPLMAQQIRGALDDLPDPVPALAIGADPARETPGRIRRFLARSSLSGRLDYLTGTRARLEPIWRAYRVTPLSAGRAAFDRAATVLLIDRRGHERVLFGVEQLTPEGLAHDVRILRDER